MSVRVDFGSSFIKDVPMYKGASGFQGGVLWDYIDVSSGKRVCWVEWDFWFSFKLTIILRYFIGAMSAGFWRVAVGTLQRLQVHGSIDQWRLPFRYHDPFPSGLYYCSRTGRDVNFRLRLQISATYRWSYTPNITNITSRRLSNVCWQLQFWAHLHGYDASSTTIHLCIIPIGILAIRVRDGLLQQALSVRLLLSNRSDRRCKWNCSPLGSYNCENVSTDIC